MVGPGSGEERLNRELASLDERLGAIETAQHQRAQAAEERAAALPQAPSAPAPSAVGRPPRRSAPAGEAASALPGEPLQQLQATVRNVHIDVRSHPRGNGIDWIVRLTDATGRALTGADVTLHGRTAGGTLVEVPLEAGEPGTYRGRLSGSEREAGGLRLRVVRHDKRFDLPLAQEISW